VTRRSSPHARLSGPNLVVSSLRLLATPPITTHHPLQFQTVVRNTGDQPVNSMFWVDLYADSSPPFSGTQPIGWSAVSGLAVSGTITLTINTSGFAVTGTHPVYAWADSWNQIAETRETDNITGPITVSVTAVGPTPTPSPTPGPDQPGSSRGRSIWSGAVRHSHLPRHGGGLAGLHPDCLHPLRRERSVPVDRHPGREWLYRGGLGGH
jgi:hypothetical protein